VPRRKPPVSPFALEEVEKWVRSGHFAYESGDHGDAWLELELLFAEPKRMRKAAQELALALGDLEADLVCSPLVGGALVGQLVASELELGFVFAERVRVGPERRRYTVPRALRNTLFGKRALVVDDALNAGSAVGGCIEELASLGATVVAVGALLIRASAESQLAKRFSVPVIALHPVVWNLWPADECRLCRAGAPLDGA
jgi:orotate phosphoribosyltransferase